MDAALQALGRKPRLDLRRAVGAVGPDLLAGVGLIKELLELLAVVDAGVGRVPLTDDLVRLIDADVVLIALVLLRQTCNRLFRFDRGLVQHGQRSSAATRRAAISRRRVAIESGTWRSVRTGSAPRPVIFGKARHFDDRAATRFRGGKGGPFGHQEGVSGYA